MARTIRHYENLHIPLWLIKDTCWMMEFKSLGMMMIVPTIGVAVFIAYKSYKQTEYYLNLAVCFWITANAYWMCCEFMGAVNLKNWAGIPFVLGMFFTVVFYFKNRKTLV